MVKLQEVEDEHFREKPSQHPKSGALLESDDDDDDFTDTGMSLSCNGDISLFLSLRHRLECPKSYLYTLDNCDLDLDIDLVSYFRSGNQTSICPKILHYI